MLDVLLLPKRIKESFKRRDGCPQNITLIVQEPVFLLQAHWLSIVAHTQDGTVKVPQ